MMFYTGYTIVLIATLFVSYYSYTNSRYQARLIERYVESESGLCFVDEQHVPNIMKSSIFYARHVYNTDVICHYYSKKSKPVLCFNESVKRDLDNMESLFSDANRVGDLGFYKTSMPCLYVFMGSEADLPKDIIVQYTGVVGDSKLRRGILELIHPKRYKSSTMPLPDVRFIMYNGNSIGFVELVNEERRVLSIDLAK